MTTWAMSPGCVDVACPAAGSAGGGSAAVDVSAQTVLVNKESVAPNSGSRSALCIFDLLLSARGRPAASSRPTKASTRDLRERYERERIGCATAYALGRPRLAAAVLMHPMQLMHPL